MFSSYPKFYIFMIKMLLLTKNSIQQLDILK